MAPRKELDPQIRSRICELHSIGWGPTKIYRQHPEIPLSTIKTTIRRESIRVNNTTRARSGRPRKLTEQQRDHIYDLVQSEPHIRHIDLLTEVDHVVKRRSIQYLLSEMGCRKWKQLNRPEIKPIHAAKRLAWARRYEHYTAEDWARVKWSDEYMVERGIGVRPTWTFLRPRDQLKNHDIHAKPCGKGIKQMFWAAFGEDIRTGLVPLDSDPESAQGGVTAAIILALYRAFLPDLLQEGDIFMHDGASIHRTYIVREGLEEMGIEVMEWPPYSPDLNPIENLWALMKEEIYKLYPELLTAPNTASIRELLTKAAQEAWHSIENRVLVRLSTTMPHRVQAVIEADGWYTKY